jgi:hypothetical protein
VVVANWAMVRRGTAANTANTTAMMLHKGSPLLFKPASKKNFNSTKSICFDGCPYNGQNFAGVRSLR